MFSLRGRDTHRWGCEAGSHRRSILGTDPVLKRAFVHTRDHAPDPANHRRQGDDFTAGALGQGSKDGVLHKPAGGLSLALILAAADQDRGCSLRDSQVGLLSVK